MSVRLYSRSRAINRGHAVGMSVVALVALWLMRAFIFSSRLPAGTDMLGFITRARENSVGGRMFSLWAPSVFGAPRQFTFDNTLGALTILTRDPVVTVKLVAVLALFSSGALTYLLPFRWSAQTLRDLLGDGERMAKYASAGPSLVRSEFSLSTSCEALAALFDDLLSTSPRERVA